jgi:hypothetical protein
LTVDVTRFPILVTGLPATVGRTLRLEAPATLDVATHEDDPPQASTLRGWCFEIWNNRSGRVVTNDKIPERFTIRVGNEPNGPWPCLLRLSPT